MKIQAIIYLPLIFVYIQSINGLSFKIKIKLILNCFLIIAFSRIITNPYLIHPEGLAEFIQGFKSDMISNQTNHGGADVTFLDKIKMLNNWYLNIVLLMITIIILLSSLYQFLVKKDYGLNKQLSITILLNLVYLIFFINKAWQSYYLACFSLIIIVLHFFILKNYPKKYVLIFTVFICLNIIIQFENFHEYIFKYKFSQNKEVLYFNKSNYILKKYVKPDDNILVVGNGVVNFKELGLNFENIHYVYGNFEKKHILNYNNHYPGRSVIKNFVLVSKTGLNDDVLSLNKKVLGNYYLIEDSQNFILYSLSSNK